MLVQAGQHGHLAIGARELRSSACTLMNPNKTGPLAPCISTTHLIHVGDSMFGYSMLEAGGNGRRPRPQGCTLRSDKTMFSCRPPKFLLSQYPLVGIVVQLRIPVFYLAIKAGNALFKDYRCSGAVMWRQ